MSDPRYVVRFQWPGPEAFASREVLERALTAGAGRVETELRERSPRPAGTGGGRLGPYLGGLLGGLFGAQVLGKMIGRPGPTRGGRSDGDGGEGAVRSWQPAGGAAWEIEAGARAVEELQASGLRVDPDVGFALPPPAETTVAAGAAAEADQLHRLGVDSSVHAKSRGAGVRVSVIDSGLDPAHPEFAHTDIDRAACWDWYHLQAPRSGVVAPIPRLAGKGVAVRHFHGTAVAGLVAGGTRGVAPGATVMVHNVLYQRSADEIERLSWRDANGQLHRPDASLASMQHALVYSAFNAADIIVLSLGTEGYNACFEDEIEGIRRHNEGTLVVVAAGNSGPGSHWSPGDYRDVLTVGAVDWEGGFWAGTSGATLDAPAGYRKPDIYAPGVDLDLPVPLGVSPEGSLRKSGTSFATPVVAGVAALVLGWYRARGKTLSAAELRDHLLQTADDVAVPEQLGGTGRRLNVRRAVAGLGAGSHV